MPILPPLLPLTVMLWGMPVGRAVRAGVTTDEIDRIVYEACIERYASFLPYPALSRQDTGPGTHSTTNLWLTSALSLWRWLCRDAYPSPLNYHHFPKSVCTSVNEVRDSASTNWTPLCPHALPPHVSHAIISLQDRPSTCHRQVPFLRLLHVP